MQETTDRERLDAALAGLGVPYELFPCDPDLAGTAQFCAAYGFSPEDSANTIVVVGKADPRVYAACIVLAVDRLDVNRMVTAALGTRKASFASSDETRDLTGMAIGGVTPFGLPAGLRILVDGAVMTRERIVLGGGSRSWKVLAVPRILLALPGVEVIGGLAKRPGPVAEMAHPGTRHDPEPIDDGDVRPATAGELADVAAMHSANRQAWDEAAERYEGWLAEAVELIRSGGTNLLPPELELIGDLHGRCRRAIHLQCAGGRDTLSLWNLGADEVVGVDFSPRMLALAERLTRAVGAPARWIEADVLETPHELDGTADLLYTGRGSLMWIQDIDRWASVVARLLAPEGRFVLFEGHPVEWLFDIGKDGRWVATDYDYFAGPEASRGWDPGYIDQLSLPDAAQSWKFARAWTLGQVVTALLRAGVRLERLTEHPTDWWGGHADALPEERGRIPLSFSILGRGPGSTDATRS